MSPPQPLARRGTACRRATGKSVTALLHEAAHHRESPTPISRRSYAPSARDFNKKTGRGSHGSAPRFSGGDSRRRKENGKRTGISRIKRIEKRARYEGQTFLRASFGRVALAIQFPPGEWGRKERVRYSSEGTGSLKRPVRKMREYRGCVRPRGPIALHGGNDNILNSLIL